MDQVIIDNESIPEFKLDQETIDQLIELIGNDIDVIFTGVS